MAIFFESISVLEAALQEGRFERLDVEFGLEEWVTDIGACRAGAGAVSDEEEWDKVGI